jgi:peptidoglycan biosynthesis protein MviN/MurJ (putative lipid II flippase)
MGVLLQSYGQSKKIAFGSLMDIMVSLLLMYLLYPLTGTIGIALAIVISTYLQAGYYLWESARMMQLSIAELVPVKYLLKWLLALALPYGMLYILKDQFSSALSFQQYLLLPW